MKCLICDSDYPDDWVTCPKDGNDLRSPTPTVERPTPDPEDMLAPAYGLPPMASTEPPPAARSPQLMVSAYGMSPMPPPGISTPPPVPMMAPAYGIPPMRPRARPPILLVVALAVIAIAAIILAIR